MDDSFWTYEQRARLAKARTLTRWCRDEGLNADAVIAMNDATRRQACADAFVNLASDQTWTLVVGMLSGERSRTPNT